MDANGKPTSLATSAPLDSDQLDLPKPKHKHKRVLLTLVVVLLLLGIVGIGIGVWYRWHRLSRPYSVAHDQAAIAAAQSQAFSGDSNTALKTLQGALDRTTNPAQKRDLLTQQGTTYANAKEYQKALTSYQQAAQYGLTFNLAQLIAQTAQEQGDKQLAITYYKKAITLIPSSDPTRADDKQGMEAIIASLGGQP